MFYADEEMHYLRYLSPHKPGQPPQTDAMSVGSAFDAYVKSYLHIGLFGKGKDPKFDLDALLTAQCEPHIRDWAAKQGAYCFEQYKSAGCLADLMTELQKAQGEPRFEFELLGAVRGEKEPVTRLMADVPFLGKPDCYFVTSQGVPVVLDFKVNGYVSKWPKSPAKGYLRMRSENKFNHGMHKACHPLTHNGFLYNTALTLDEVDESWAAQLAIYAWLLGEPIGGNFMVGIDQLVCDARTSNPPKIRIAEHRCQINASFQMNLFRRAIHCWEVINSDHIFRSLSKSDSEARCKALDLILQGQLAASQHKDGDWLMNAAGR